jgi:signal transduction histidine kinase
MEMAMEMAAVLPAFGVGRHHPRIRIPARPQAGDRRRCSGSVPIPGRATPNAQLGDGCTAKLGYGPIAEADRAGGVPMSKTSGSLRTTPVNRPVWAPNLALSMLLTAAGYYALAVVGTVLSVPPTGFAIIWPATPFLVSVLILTPMRQWWPCLLAVIPAHVHMVHVFQSGHVPVMVVLCQLAGNFSLAIVTVLVVRATGGPRLRFDTFQGLLLFILLAGVAIPAAINALTLCLHLWTRWATDFWLSWRQWMLASVFPTVTIPPLAVVAMRRPLLGLQTSNRGACVELASLLLALLVLSHLAFGGSRPDPEHLPVLLLAPLPLLLWAAVRLGVGGTCLALLVFAGALLVSALAGHGPFALPAPIADVVSLQAFLISISIPLVLLAALVEERKLVAASLQLSEQRLLTLHQEWQQRIAQELHDSTSQHLTAMALGLTMLKTRAGAEVAGTIEDIRVSLKEATRELGSFGYLLHPAEVQRDGLHSTLQRYVEGFARRTQLQVNVSAARCVDELPLPIQETLLRIVQESLANVYRHASASRVTIKLRRVGTRLHLVIADNGKGIGRELPSHVVGPLSRGVGIPGMEARARQVAGRLELRSRRKGTIVHLAIPMRR